MSPIVFGLIVLAAFIGTEVFAYLLHRFVLHGPLWVIHRTHHRKHKLRRNFFELNDVVPFALTGIAVALLLAGRSNPLESVSFAVGLGMPIYGLLFFVLHVFYIHRRWMPFRTDNRAARLIRRAHRHHHQSREQAGRRPYGFLIVPYRKFRQARRL